MVQRQVERMVAAIHFSLKNSPRAGRVACPMTWPVFFHLFSPDPGQVKVSDCLEELLQSKFVDSDRLTWLDQHGQGRAIDQMTVRHHVRQQDAAFAWKSRRATEQPPFVEEQVVVYFTKKVISKV